MPKGFKHSEESKIKIGLAHKGKKISERHRQKLSQALRGRISTKGMLGKKHSEETKRKISENNGKYLLGKHLSEEVKNKISETKKARGQRPQSFDYWKDKKFSEEHRKKISNSLKGHASWSKGKKLSKEHGKKVSLALKGKYIGKLNWNWQEGKSFEPYTVDWTKTLKRSIRERDKYICQICKEPQKDVALSVHHIDYIKKNNNPENLISLCCSCHIKTNFNREKWIKFFYEHSL